MHDITEEQILTSKQKNTILSHANRIFRDRLRAASPVGWSPEYTSPRATAEGLARRTNDLRATAEGTTDTNITKDALRICSIK